MSSETGAAGGPTAADAPALAAAGADVAALDGAGFDILGFDASIVLLAAAVFICLVLSAFFSGSETALTAASRSKLHARADGGDKGAATALRLKENNERFIGAILIGNNIVNILGTALATVLFTRLVGEQGVAVATLVMTALVVVFAEITPKTYAISAPETFASAVSRIIALIVRVLGPVIMAVGVLVRLILRAFGVRADPQAHVLAVEEIRGAIDMHHSEGAVEKADRDRLLAALDLPNREVSEVMIHRRNLETLDLDMDADALVSACLGSAHTRIPVWRDDAENIVGILHAKDLARAMHAHGAGGERPPLDVEGLLREPWFIPDTTSLDEQLRAFLARRSHFALVVDEYGALRGLITLEDILEEIVGDISDEHDKEMEGMERLPDGSVSLPGATTIRDLNRAMDWALPDDEANTVAGLVIHEAQTIPATGQVFSFHGFRFEVLERRRNQITRVKLRPLDRPAA